MEYDYINSGDSTALGIVQGGGQKTKKNKKINVFVYTRNIVSYGKSKVLFLFLWH